MYERYCKIRDSKGFKDSDVARITGITKSTFSDWKSNRYTPKTEKLSKIAECLGVTLEYLLGSQNIEYDYKTYTWDISENFELQEVLADEKLRDRLLAYASKLLELKKMEDE